MECNDFVKKFEEIEDWEKTNDGREAFAKLFKFSDFKQAFSFMTSVSSIAEKHDHHPNWKNVYNKVEIRLFTHEANGLTERDFKLAKEIDQIIVRSQEIVSKTIDVE